MQKVITIRASQKDLQDYLNELIDIGWKVISVVKGYEWRSVGWTVILEKDGKEEVSDSENSEIENIQKKAASASYRKQIAWSGLSIILAGLIVLFACLL